MANFGEAVTVQMLADYMGVAEKTVRRRVKDHGGYEVRDNEVIGKDRDKVD